MFTFMLLKCFMMYVKKKRAHEVMKWRQSVRKTEKQEAEREAVESKIQEHLQVLYYSLRLYCFMENFSVLYSEHWIIFRYYDMIFHHYQLHTLTMKVNLLWKCILIHGNCFWCTCLIIYMQSIFLTLQKYNKFTILNSAPFQHVK